MIFFANTAAASENPAQAFFSEIKQVKSTSDAFKVFKHRFDWVTISEYVHGDKHSAKNHQHLMKDTFKRWFFIVKKAKSAEVTQLEATDTYSIMKISADDKEHLIKVAFNTTGITDIIIKDNSIFLSAKARFNHGGYK